MLKSFPFILLLLLGFTLQSQAQKDPKAKAVLDAVSKKYNSLNGLKASFDYSYHQSGAGSQQNQSGEITVKGDKYHLKLPDQEIINNGKTVWTYIVSGNYKEVTINHADDMKDDLTPSSIYNIYQKGYNYKLIGEKTENGTVIQEIELIAEKPKAAFKKINLLVNKNTQNLSGWEIYDDQGGVFKYRFKSINTSVDLKDDYFTFNPQKYGKIEIIDLR
jgi:outer membrane lipoprotein-sorting protein